MPGIVITTNVRSGPPATVDPTSGQFFMVGLFERGVSNTPVLIQSLPELVRNFGVRTSFSDAWDHLATYFSEGGGRAYVTRVVGPAATIGTLSINDRASGSPIPTLRFDAASAGAWSTNVTVEVADGLAANSFRVTVRYAGDIVEDYNNLLTPADAVAKFNTSPYVRATNLGSATAAPANIPAVTAATALSAGTDDRGSVTSSSYVTALDYFSPELGDGSVAIPGSNGTTIWDGLIAHAKNNNRIALLGAPRNETDTNLKTAAASMNSEYAGLFAPWIVVPTDGNSTRVISPEAYVAAARARAHRQVGQWRVPAGAIAAANYVIDVDQLFTAAQADSLDASKVSVVRRIASNVRLYGWRSLSNDVDNWLYLKDRDLLNFLTVEANKRLEKFVFEVIDAKGQLLSVLAAELVGLVDPIAKANGLFARYAEDGSMIDPGYVVSTGSDLNPPSSLAQNKVNAAIAVRLAPTGSLINLSINKVTLLGSLS